MLHPRSSQGSLSAGGDDWRSERAQTRRDINEKGRPGAPLFRMNCREWLEADSKAELAEALLALAGVSGKDGRLAGARAETGWVI